MNTGSVLAQFTITLSKAVTEPVAVEWFTSDGTAKAGVDYAANKGAAIFAPGETQKIVEILVFGRAIGSEDRSFFVEMLPPTNAILGASIGECIIHVDTTGSQPVTQIIVPTGPKGDEGEGAYETWLQLPGNAGKTEQDFIDSLKPSPQEIAQEVAPLLDVGDTVLTAEGTEILGTPDQTTVKALARRVAYVAPAKIATVTLADGDNTLDVSDLSGDQISFAASGFVPRIMRNGAFFEPSWRTNIDGTITVIAATAGDILYATQYDVVSTKNPLARKEDIQHLQDKLLNTDAGNGSSMIGAKLPLDGAEPRTQDEKNADFVSVKDFKAKGDGVTDDTEAFSRAAKAVQAKDITTPLYLGVPHAPYCEVHVPAGRYLLSSLVDVGNRDVVWIVEAGATFINASNLNGRLSRIGVRFNNGMQHGTLDGASSLSVSGNRGNEAPAQVLGVTAPNQLAVYADRDTVGLHAENYAPALLADPNVSTYTANSAVLSGSLSADQVKKLRVGMVADTTHTPTKYTGVITGWEADGSAIYVEGWYLADGENTSHNKVTPPAGSRLQINPFTKAWALNANVFLDDKSHAKAAVGMELGVSNNKFDYDPVTETWNTWCYDSITLGTKRCETGYMQRGYFYKGFESRGATEYNYTARNSSPTSWAGGAVYHSNADSDTQILIQPASYGKKASFAVHKDGSMELGRTDGASVVTIDFHSSGNENDFDSRITSSGGTAAVGGGTMTLTANSLFFSPGYIVEKTTFRPDADSGRNLGQASFRFNAVYAASGTINTSDINHKKFLEIEESEKEAAQEIKGMMRKFQFRSALEEKGENDARYHFGVGAQYVRDVLIKHGLEPDMYGFLCFDQWDDIYEDVFEEIAVEREVQGIRDVLIEVEGKKISTVEKITYTVMVKEMQPTGEKRLIKKAGEIYGIRYDELLCFIISAM